MVELDLVMLVDRFPVAANPLLFFNFVIINFPFGIFIAFLIRGDFTIIRRFTEVFSHEVFAVFSLLVYDFHIAKAFFIKSSF